MGSRKYGGLWISLPNSTIDRVERILDSGSVSFTKAIPISIIREGASTLSLLSTTAGEVNYIAIVTSGIRISDLERKIQIGHVVELNRPLSSEQLLDSIPSALKRHALLSHDSITTISPGTWNHLFKNTVTLSESSKQKIEKLLELMKSRSQQNRDSLPDVISFERDAIATALDVFGGSALRRNIISDSAAVGTAPFITRLKHKDVQQIEDQMISHDTINFPGLKSLSSCMVGAVQLNLNSGTLTVLNANRTSIEKTLGVDLIYYNHDRASFVLIQYKRLTGKKEPVYRPNLDSNLEKELVRMRAFTTTRNSVTDDYLNYRLNDNPFFLKLCKAQSPGDWNGRMLHGMYFPVEMWDLLMKSDFIKGPKGGQRVGFESAPRRLSNSEFTRLLSRGWIGTNAIDTERLNDLLVNLLSDGHSVVAAVQENRQNGSEYFRDQSGRFQSQDDEFAI